MQQQPLNQPPNKQLTTQAQVNGENNLQNSMGVALGQQSQQHLKVSSQQRMHKSPSSYMSEDSAPAHKVLESKKVKFYAQVEAIKDTRLIENLASLKSKIEKQKCIDSFAEIYDAMIKTILEISDVIKQIRFNEPIQMKVSNVSQYQQTNGNTQIHNGSSAHANNQTDKNTNNPNNNYNPNTTNAAADTKMVIEIGDLPDQIIKDSKSIHNLYADLVQDSSLKHLELCCETFVLDGSSINLKFKISTWYNEIKEFVERNRPTAAQSKNASKQGSSSKGFSCFLCPCFGSKKPKETKSTMQNLPQNNTSFANQQQQQQQQQVMGRGITNQAIQNQRTTYDINV